MLYSDHLTDAVLGTHTPNPWRWRDATAIERPYVHDAVANTTVPHRDVRKWLKSRGLLMQSRVQSGAGR